MIKRTLKILLAFGCVTLFPGLASAHILPGTSHGFHDGFLHPFTGLDHLLAMFAVGLWAAQYRGRAVWLIPLSFVGTMAFGGFMGVAGAFMPGTEFWIASSILVLGGLIATATRFTPTFGMLLVGFFALFHGYAHGHEMPASASALPFSVGFILATLCLHAAGMGCGIYFRNHPRAIRFAGLAVALSSFYFMAA